jgi:ABC-type protease/lipase transport system fused ATPase/permease subunit
MLVPRALTHPDVASALRECRRAFAGVALFSGMVNLLMLAGPLYMLQIYDRVLNSRSVPTLVALSLFLVGAYAFQGALDLIRSRVVVRVAALLDQRLALTVHDAVIRLAIARDRYATFAASAAGSPPTATSTAIFRFKRSAAKAGSSSYRPLARLNSIVTSWSSM